MFNYWFLPDPHILALTEGLYELCFSSIISSLTGCGLTTTDRHNCMGHQWEALVSRSTGKGIGGLNVSAFGFLKPVKHNRLGFQHAGVICHELEVFLDLSRGLNQTSLLQMLPWPPKVWLTHGQALVTGFLDAWSKGSLHLWCMT